MPAIQEDSVPTEGQTLYVDWEYVVFGCCGYGLNYQDWDSHSDTCGSCGASIRYVTSDSQEREDLEGLTPHLTYADISLFPEDAFESADED